jgi:HEAT repeat protein
MKNVPDYEDADSIPLANAQDNAILMHRDVHFGGKFDIMLDYYINEGKGVNPEFNLERIHELALMEKGMKEDLAAVMLSGPDAEKIAEAKNAYKKLRQLYEKPKPETKNLRLIADLILSEEENPESEMAAIIQEKSAIVPALIEVLKADEFYDPLFPGYGLAPSLAAQCLGQIGDKRAIITLFEAMGQGDFFDEDVALNALKAIGARAKEFLLKVVHGRPLNEDNEKAAIALIAFKEDEEVSKACLEMLKDLQVRKDAALATYLTLACEGLKKPEDQQAFQKLAEDPATPKILLQDIKVVAKTWK